jgi:hypothetical protein
MILGRESGVSSIASETFGLCKDGNSCILANKREFPWISEESFPDQVVLTPNLDSVGTAA